MALLTRSRPPEPPDDGDDDRLRQLQADVDTIRDANVRRELAELRARVAKGRREQEERDSKTRGGPCSYCGVTQSHGWHGNPGRMMCTQCADDRWDHSDDEHRSLILRRIVSGNWDQRTYAIGKNAALEASRAGFRFFYETPGAQPGGWSRWSFVDLEAVRLRATPASSEPPPPRYTGSDPCRRCGCSCMWCPLPGKTVPALDRDYTVNMPPGDRRDGTPVVLGCAGCFGYATAAVRARGGGYEYEYDLREVARRIIGVNLPSNEDPADIGLTWYESRPVNPAEKRSVTYAPFGYLDLWAVRRAAIARYPFSSQWVNQSVYAQLVAEHGNPLGPLQFAKRKDDE